MKRQPDRVLDFLKRCLQKRFSSDQQDIPPGPNFRNERLNRVAQQAPGAVTLHGPPQPTPGDDADARKIPGNR